jgi:hypothetical protein
MKNNLESYVIKIKKYYSYVKKYCKKSKKQESVLINNDIKRSNTNDEYNIININKSKFSKSDTNIAKDTV